MLLNLSGLQTPVRNVLVKPIANLRRQRWALRHQPFGARFHPSLQHREFGVAADSFEAVLDELVRALGFETQRPDKEWKQGPDNLWALRDNQYLLFECKNQVDKTRKEINKNETRQMNNSCAWFKKHYGDSPCKKPHGHLDPDGWCCRSGRWSRLPE